MPSSSKSSAAPARKSTAAKSTAAPKPADDAGAAPAKSSAKPALTPAERMKMIAEAAYYLAEKRGFTGGNELSDWVAAEKQVDTLISKRG
jgi:hypothetical protein